MSGVTCSAGAAGWKGIVNPSVERQEWVSELSDTVTDKGAAVDRLRLMITDGPERNPTLILILTCCQAKFDNILSHINYSEGKV